MVTLENFGGCVGRDVELFADGWVHEVVGEVLVNMEPLESISTGGRHCNDKIWSSTCLWAEEAKTTSRRPS